MIMACGLDIGSNTFSFTELRQSDRGAEVVHDLSVPVRLSEGLVHGGALEPAAVKRGLATLEKLCGQFDLRNKPLRVVGTAVLRMAANPEIFTGPARDILGVEVEIISGEQEALLASEGAIFDIHGQGPWIIVDVGGQSTEVCFQDKEGKWNPVSLPMGVVGLTQKLFFHDPPTRDELAALEDEIAPIISQAIPDQVSGRLVGVAGTATTLGLVELALTTWQREKVHGLEIEKERLGYWLEEMLSMTASQRTKRYGISTWRSDVFPSGLFILKKMLTYLNLGSLTVSANGLRVGVALRLIRQED
jgi:exopolyphosphatase/guanosine-5'-triphosphate,3'-diphosphate pyrophosphatase